ncbi:MAG: alpha/beta hydrolase [Prevotella sp.]
MRKLTITLLSLIVCVTWAQNYKEVYDIPYTNKTDAYAKERLKLDIHYDEEGKNLPVIVWFHGGGLTQGEKEMPKKLKDKGFVVVGVNYRLLPNVSIDKTLDDAAESLAWITKNIGKYGGDSKKIVVSGHSAGGYITLMLALDRKWLARYGVDANDMVGYVPFSGQAISHYSYRKMLGIDNLQPTIDEYAPLFWVRKDCPPMELIVGDRELELFGRYEENAYLWRMMKLIGNTTTNIYELDGHDHGGMVDPGFNILERFVRNITK